MDGDHLSGQRGRKLSPCLQEVWGGQRGIGIQGLWDGLCLGPAGTLRPSLMFMRHGPSSLESTLFTPDMNYNIFSYTYTQLVIYISSGGREEMKEIYQAVTSDYFSNKCVLLLESGAKTIE